MENTSRNKKQLHQKSLNGGTRLTCSEPTEHFLRAFIFEETLVQDLCNFHYSPARSVYLRAYVNTLTEPQIRVFKAASL